MPFLRNEFLRIFGDLFTMIFLNFLAVKCSLERYSNFKRLPSPFRQLRSSIKMPSRTTLIIIFLIYLKFIYKFCFLSRWRNIISRKVLLKCVLGGIPKVCIFLSNSIFRRLFRFELKFKNE